MRDQCRGPAGAVGGKRLVAIGDDLQKAARPHHRGDAQFGDLLEPAGAGLLAVEQQGHRDPGRLAVGAEIGDRAGAVEIGGGKPGAVARVGQQIVDDRRRVGVVREARPGAAGLEPGDLERDVGQGRGRAQLHRRAGDVAGAGIADDRQVGDVGARLESRVRGLPVLAGIAVEPGRVGAGHRAVRPHRVVAGKSVDRAGPADRALAHPEGDPHRIGGARRPLLAARGFEAAALAALRIGAGVEAAALAEHLDQVDRDPLRAVADRHRAAGLAGVVAQGRDRRRRERIDERRRPAALAALERAHSGLGARGSP